MPSKIEKFEERSQHKWAKANIGLTLGNWTLLRITGESIKLRGKTKTPRHLTYVECRCSCGNIAIITVDSFKLAGKKGGKCISCSNSNSGTFDARLTSARKIYTMTYKDGKLTFEQFYKMSQQDCYYCGTPPMNRFNVYKQDSIFQFSKGEFVYNGLDRLDSNKPHDLDNCVPCCVHCNRAKLNRSKQDFLDWIKKVYLHQHR